MTKQDAIWLAKLKQRDDFTQINADLLTLGIDLTKIKANHKSVCFAAFFGRNLNAIGLKT